MPFEGPEAPRGPQCPFDMTQREEIQFRLLQVLKDEPQISQRELALRMGISLGLTNYCLKALITKGWVKTRNFFESGRKDRYLYQLTPQGIANKAQLTREFLARKRAEYQAIEAEIRDLEATLEETGTDLFFDRRDNPQDAKK